MDGYDDLLIQTAVIFRRSGDLDRFGQPEGPGLSEHGRYPCRATNASGGEQNTERSHDVIITNHKVFVSSEADVREDDELTVVGINGEEIVPRGNITLMRQPYDGAGPHHVELTVTCQRQAR